MSEKSFWDTASITEGAIIASHSNSAHICPHTRNLSDIQFRTIAERAGLVGINLYPPFVSPKFKSSFSIDESINILSKHILHFLSLGGEKTICLGADRDGFDRIENYSQLRYIGKLYEKLTACGVKDKTIKDIFFGNAMNFFKKHLP
jgi:membrane dipeptidase